MVTKAISGWIAWKSILTHLRDPGHGKVPKWLENKLELVPSSHHLSKWDTYPLPQEGNLWEKRVLIILYFQPFVFWLNHPLQVPCISRAVRFHETILNEQHNQRSVIKCCLCNNPLGRRILLGVGLWCNYKDKRYI